MEITPSSLFFPDPSGHPELQFLPVATGEEESHVALDDEAIETITDFAVAVPYAPRHTLPDHLSPIPTDLKTVTVVFRLVVITHKPQECYVDWSHSKLKGLEVQAEILTEATKNLEIHQNLITIVPFEKLTTITQLASVVSYGQHRDLSQLIWYVSWHIRDNY